MDRESRRSEVTGQLSTISALTAFQRRFLIEYLSQPGPANATAAYIAAGGTAKHADRAAHQLRHSERVVAAIDEYFHHQEMSAREVVARLSQQAKAEYGRYLKWDAVTREATCDLERLLADGLGHLIKKIGYERTGADSAAQVVEFYDAHTALVDVGRYHGLFKDKTDLTSKGEKLDAINIYIPDNGRDGGDNADD